MFPGSPTNQHDEVYDDVETPYSKVSHVTRKDSKLDASRKKKVGIKVLPVDMQDSMLHSPPLRSKTAQNGHVVSGDQKPYKPIIKQGKPDIEGRSKLPRVPIDASRDEYNRIYENIYQLKRTGDAKAAQIGVTVLPNKPKVTVVATDSFAAPQEYEELPFDRMRKQPVDNEKQNPPPLPPKLETETTTKGSNVYFLFVLHAYSLHVLCSVTMS